mgnify:CR=1 FL=1
MKAILVGGSGLIGRELAKELLEHGHDPVILSRHPLSAPGIPSRVPVVGWDGKTADGWGQLIEDGTAIVNLAGENIAGEGFFPTRWSEDRKNLILQSRINAGRAILEAIRKTDKRPSVLVQSSAIGFYGALGNQAVDEDAPVGNDFLAKTCGAWEQSTAEIDSLGVRRVIIRTGVVLTMNGGAFTRLLLPFKFFVGGPIGNGKQVLSWIHIADEVGAIRFLIENTDASGVFNLSSPNPLTNLQFAKTISHVIKKPSWMPIPAIFFKLLFGEVATVVVDGQRVLPARLSRTGYAFRFPEAEAAIRNLLDSSKA